MALRNWRISTRLVSLLTLPVVAATALGGLRINESLERMQQLDHMELLTDMTREATKLAIALQNERDLTAGPLANKVPVGDFKITDHRQKTDRAKTAFLDTTRDIPNTDDEDSLESIRANANGIANQLSTLGAIRKEAYEADHISSLTVDSYHRLIQSLLSLSQDMAQATSNPDMIKRTRALAAFSSAKEYASMQRAIIAAALPGGAGSKGPGLQEPDRRYGEAQLKNGEHELRRFKQIYTSSGGNPELTSELDSNNPTIAAAEEFANLALGQENGLAKREQRSYLDWTDDYGVRITTMQTIEATLLGEMETKARELREESQQDAIINGALILIVLGVSLVGAFVVARSMIRSLRRLQDTATKVAQERLPELVKQLSESDPQDVDTSVESVGVHSRDEIGKVAAAFDDVHREAVRLAAEQALLRGNVNAMFTNLSRRSQGLIQRQLSLISELESREADPDQLSSLFKLDHLATRMRRNGENLLVLAGEEPGRRWTRPVPLVDVLRAAASEVEQYERIELSAVPATEVAGRVVNDLVHLLAELLENATSFSSPQTKVKVTGHALPDGRVLVEIHDTGIGLSPEDLAAINERLASPPTVDVSVSRRMGLFVVGRLSLRHGIRIQLRPSDSGGTTALVMLPVDVAQGGRKAPAGPGAAGMPPGVQPPAGAAGRPAGPGGPGAAPLGPGAQPRGQVGAGPGGQRAALPSRDGAPSQGGRTGGGLAGAFGNRGAASAPTADRANQLPPSGGPRPELPGGGSQRPQSPGWAGEQQDRRPVDAPRGHEETENAHGPAATAEFARPDFGKPAPQAGGPATEQFPRPDFDGPRPGFDAGSAPAAGQAPADGTHQGQGTHSGQYGPPGGQGQQGQGQQGQFVRPDVFGPPASAGSPGRPVPGQGGYQDQNPADTGQFQRPGRQDQDSAQADRDRRPDHQDQSTGGLPVRADYQQNPADTGQFRQPGYQDRNSGQFQQPGYQDPNSGQYPQPGYQDQNSGEYRQPGFHDPNSGQYPQPGYQDRNPADTGQFQRPGRQDQDSAQADRDRRPDHQDQSTGGLPVRADYQQNPADTGQFRRPDHQDPATGQFPRPDLGAPQPPAPGQAPAPRGYEGQQPALPAQSQPEALPHAGPGDGRTPLFDTLETDWFHTQGRGRAPQPGRPDETSAPSGASAPPAERPAQPSLPQGGPSEQTGGQDTSGSGWRTSPNDELVRQAERVRKPAAGGVTTSGLPRRVPRANLVAGTAQEQSTQSGPQVSRAPDDVRGRLTNLRRGIQQGRQQNSSTTGSFNLGPNHPQER
ncbi:nitrate- and nitrite sensing domain-containing protein [Streptomyces sp. CAU 1734]|uniref:nitrate- and nitrite sensing domain-containing protein n=1 Tax=Streptomyces sp. CAU 1734 TaxID=3140360 RepID=UPI00325FEAA9